MKQKGKKLETDKKNEERFVSLLSKVIDLSTTSLIVSF